MSVAEVITLRETTIRDVPATLRKIADKIEAGQYGEVRCLGVALLGDTMECFGIGPDSDGPLCALLFHAAFMRLAKSVEERGRE